MKKVIFSIITGDIDSLKEPVKAQSDWQYVLFTDNPELKSSVWDIVLIPKGEAKKTSRFYKIKNHFPEYDLSLYLDATFAIKKPLDPFALSKTRGIWLNKHPQRECTYEEADIVIEKGLDDAGLVQTQVDRYRSEYFPEQWGLWRCGIMVRNPKDDNITELCDTWWDEVDKGTYRDQVSFPYACWKLGIQPNTILHGITNIYFKQSLHKPNPSDTWKFVGTGEYDPSLTERYQGAHLIILKNGLLFPSWISNYISMKDGEARFIELVQILNGIVVRA